MLTNNRIKPCYQPFTQQFTSASTRDTIPPVVNTRINWDTRNWSRYATVPPKYWLHGTIEIWWRLWWRHYYCYCYYCYYFCPPT